MENKHCGRPSSAAGGSYHLTSTTLCLPLRLWKVPGKILVSAAAKQDPGCVISGVTFPTLFPGASKLKKKKKVEKGLFVFHLEAIASKDLETDELHTRVRPNLSYALFYPGSNGLKKKPVTLGRASIHT